MLNIDALIQSELEAVYAREIKHELGEPDADSRLADVQKITGGFAVPTYMIPGYEHLAPERPPLTRRQRFAGCAVSPRGSLALSALLVRASDRRIRLLSG